MTTEMHLPLIEQAESDASLQLQQVVAAPPVLFTQLTLPIGVATDLQGNVFVTYESLGAALGKFDPSGAVLGQVQLSPLISPVDLFSGARLALEPASGQILALFPAGTIQVIDPNTGAINPLLDLRQLQIRTDRVYDIALNAVVDATGRIQPALASYGDIAIFNGNGFTDLYISGISAGFPFVMRLRTVQGQLSSAEVVVSSIASAAPSQGQPPGVAVNAQGTVLTTLPIPNADATGNFNTPVAFPVDLDLQQLTGSFTPTLVSGVDIASTGMTSDAAGNFYIATSATGTSLGGTSGSGAVVVLSPSLQVENVLPIAQSVTIASNDVAVNPTGDRLYVTFNETLAVTGGAGGVALFPISLASDPLTGSSRLSQLSGLETEGLGQDGDEINQIQPSWQPLEPPFAAEAIAQNDWTATESWQSQHLSGLSSDS